MTEMVNHISMGLNGDGLSFELIVDWEEDICVLEIGNQNFCIDVAVDDEYYNINNLEEDLKKLLKKVQDLK